MKLFGYSPLESLVAATKLGGELMGLEVGAVKKGWLADLLLVAGDPTQNVTILQAQPARVFDRSVQQALARWKFNPGAEGRSYETEINFQR